LVKNDFFSGETNAYLYKFVEEHLFYFKDGKNPFGHIRYESDVPSLSSEEKLLILRALLDEKMGIDAADAFDANYTPDELRLEPLTVDRRNRKFWYFGDTYLFMEQKVRFVVYFIFCISTGGGAKVLTQGAKVLTFQ
jgi:hypothetical protein